MPIRFVSSALVLVLAVAAPAAFADAPAPTGPAPAEIAAPPSAPAVQPELAAKPSGELEPAAFAALPTAQRRAAYAGLERAKQQALIASLSMQQLVDIAHDALANLGTYGAEMIKQERMGKSELDPVQILRLDIRETPYALRFELIEGPGKGRKVLYNTALRTGQLRAKESGVLGLVGALWLDIDGSLVHGDTKHTITDTGFGAMLRLMQKDIDAAKPLGGLVRRDLGFDPEGLYCLRITAPPGAKVYAKALNLCFDPRLELPMHMECEDDTGVFERFIWRKVQREDLPDTEFNPEAMGL